MRSNRTAAPDRHHRPGPEWPAPAALWHGALDSLRIDKGYRAWKGDLSSDYTMLQAGLARFIDWDKPDFRGKAALMAEAARAPDKRFTLLRIEPGDSDPPYMRTVWADGAVAGEVTSAAWGHRVGACIGLAMLRADLAVAGTRVAVEVFRERRGPRFWATAPYGMQ